MYSIHRDQRGSGPRLYNLRALETHFFGQALPDEGPTVLENSSSSSWQHCGVCSLTSGMGLPPSSQKPESVLPAVGLVCHHTAGGVHIGPEKGNTSSSVLYPNNST